MPGSDLPIFDLNTPYPKAIVEGLRQAVVAALVDLRQAIQDVGYATDDVGSSFGLIDTAFELLGGALTAVDDLTTRVAALEAAAVPPVDPTLEAAP